MFWGLNLKPNRKYTQTTSKSFHISQASLDADSAQDGANKIYITSENEKYLICTLRKEECEQVPLDLNFVTGDEISFQTVGSGHVTLSGYIIEEDNYFNEDESEEESDLEEAVVEEDLRNALNKKAKAKEGKANKLKANVENVKANKAKANAENVKGNKAKANAEDKADNDEDDEDDEDDSDANITMENDVGSADESDDDEEDDDDDDEDGGEDEDDDDDDEEDDSEEEEAEEPKAKQAKLEKPQKQQNGIAKEKVSPAENKKKDKKAKNEKPQQQQQQPKSGGERTLAGGVKVIDLRIGTGAEAKTGKRAHVYYEGRLKTNNKVFDSLKEGAPFKFAVGRNEVIKGWDVGVAGMKVGGKRRIICPPHMAYGARGSPPAIPPNSTLVFEVQLQNVN